jgi:peroxiredoxin Q/BCP
MSTAGDHGLEAGSLNNRESESWKTRNPAGKSSNSVLKGLYLMTGILVFSYPISGYNPIIKYACQIVKQSADKILRPAGRYPHLFDMPELKEGDTAPAISLESDSTQPFTLASLKGKNVVLYFYPKADTPGCTKEACEFRDTTKKFSKANTVIVGVSPDASKSQAKFKEKFDLPFILLADVEHKTCEDYGVWKEKSMYGKKYMGVERTTFVIDPKGKIKKIFPKVKVEGHAEEVLAAIG